MKALIKGTPLEHILQASSIWAEDADCEIEICTKINKGWTVNKTLQDKRKAIITWDGHNDQIMNDLVSIGLLP